MKIDETTEALRLLVKSDSKVEVWARLDGGEPMTLHPAPSPFTASDALKAVQAVHDVADSHGKTATFSLRRCEVAA